jgi:hypothetical protein
MIMAATENEPGHNILRRAFATPEFKCALRPVLAIEQFNAGPR